MSKRPRRRTDYWDDPRAPAATSRKPSASVVLRNHRGELLLLRRVGSGLWTIPTGALKKKETVTACAIRECREETGLAVELTGLVGVFSDPRHRIAYPDGEVRVPVNVCFYGQPVSGGLATDSESDEAAWVAPEDLDDYDIHPAIRRRISHALNGAVPHVDLTVGRAGVVGSEFGCPLDNEPADGVRCLPLEGHAPRNPPLRFAPRGGTSPGHRPLAGPQARFAGPV